MTRRIVLAPSFDAEFFAISWYIQEQFGAATADKFEARFKRLAMTLAESPKVGTTEHGYPTALYGVVL